MRSPSVCCSWRAPRGSEFCSNSRLKWFGEGRDFDRAVPLEETGAVLPTQGEQYRNCVNVYLFVFLVASALGAGCCGSASLVLSPLVLASSWLARGWSVARWERCHGLLLWNGRTRAGLPEGDQHLYSSVR